jgi:hypothetical protein
MRLSARLRAMALAGIAACLLPSVAPAADVTPTAATRVEARSPTTLAVGIVQQGRMAIHLSRVLDNAPIRDAALTVTLRGVVHPTVAEADGSYTMQSKDLALPGSAAVVFQFAQGDVHEELKGALQIAGDDAGKPEDKNSARQLGWWVLNFGVCIGFLMLWNRRRKRSAEAE